MNGGFAGRSLIGMKRSTLPILLLAALAACLLIPSAALAASTGTLSVSVAGAPKKPKKAKRQVTVRAINIATGFVSESAVSKKTNPTIKLAPGAYVVAVRTIDIPGVAAEGVSGIAYVKAGRKTKKKLRVKPLKKSKKKKAKKSATIAKKKKSLWAPDSEYAGLRVIGVDPRLTLKGLDQYPSGLEIDSVVTAPLSNGCNGDEPKVRLVEIRRRAEIIEEIERGDDPMFERTVERGHLMRERELVKGSALIADGKITVYLRLVNVKTGEVSAASAVIGDAGSVDGILGAIESAGQDLLDQICSPKVDVTFAGSATYRRDEGTAATDSQDAVRASYNWSVTYQGVNLAGDGMLNFATASSVSGNWTTDGRYGVAGPGSYSCAAPIASYSGEFSMLRIKRLEGSTQLTIDPFLSIQGDHAATTCTGLPGPPYSSFVLMGAAAPQQAMVQIAPQDLAAGPRTFNVGPTASLAPDCSDLVGSVHQPCTQSGEWSGTVTVTPAT